MCVYVVYVSIRSLIALYHRAKQEHNKCVNIQGYSFFIEQQNSRNKYSQPWEFNHLPTLRLGIRSPYQPARARLTPFSRV